MNTNTPIKRGFKRPLAFMQQFKFKNWTIGQLENSIFDVTNRLVFVKSLRVLNCYLVKLQPYKCGIWKSWAPSWNRTNLLSRQSETLLIMISFNFSQKGFRQFMSCQFFNHFLNCWCIKIQICLTKELGFNFEIEQICWYEVKHG